MQKKQDKKDYTPPSLQIIVFAEEDIIVTSPNGDPGTADFPIMPVG